MAKKPVEPALIAQRLANALERANELKEAAEKAVKEAKEAIIAALDGNELGAFPDGRFATYLLQERKEHIVKASEFRVLRIVKELPEPK